MRMRPWSLTTTRTSIASRVPYLSSRTVRMRPFVLDDTAAKRGTGETRARSEGDAKEMRARSEGDAKEMRALSEGDKKEMRARSEGDKKEMRARSE